MSSQVTSKYQQTTELDHLALELYQLIRRVIHPLMSQELHRQLTRQLIRQLIRRQA